MGLEKKNTLLLKGMIKYNNTIRIITIALSTECSLDFTGFQREVKSQVQIRHRFARMEV